MAQRRQLTLQPSWLATAWVVAALVLPISAVLSMFWQASAEPMPWRWIGNIIQFTLLQASLSTLGSVLLGIVIGRTLARRSFIGRNWLIAWLDACFVMPGLLIVLAILLTWSPTGAVGQFLDWKFYGLPAILLAHWFFETPLIARVVMQQMQRIPEAHIKQAQQLGLTDWQMWRLLDWPAIRAAIFPVAGLVFLICMTSFPVVVSLGGGPGSTTLEIAIYQALHYEFDFYLATWLAVIQLAIGVLLALLILRHLLDSWGAGPINVQRSRPELTSTRYFDGLVILVCLAYWLAPILGLLVKAGWQPLLDAMSSAKLWQATGQTLMIATASAMLGVMLAIGLQAGRGRFAMFVGYTVMLVPSMMLATGAFIILWRYGDALWQRLAAIALLNALMIVPFAIKLLRPAKNAAQARYGRQMTMLGLSQWQRWRWIYWPKMATAIAGALGLAFMLAAGDLGAALMLSSHDLNTLPLRLYRLIGARQLEQALWVGAWLVFIGVMIQRLLAWLARRYHA
ncbi:ABC transporter permease subunit [Salinibius halmophilus]|uniref:ABC transporter permease subunit n=1 Tax=Salinibius halmophilus TaxID=1853216 RepID=UPI000E664A96|nr:ABC transporter permease subunit [Salinibius halmophilus]